MLLGKLILGLLWMLGMIYGFYLLVVLLAFVGWTYTVLVVVIMIFSTIGVHSVLVGRRKDERMYKE